MPDLHIDQLAAFGRRAYERAGLSPADASLVVDIQLSADLRGVDTHGFQRLPWYVEHLREGRYNAQPRLAALQETGVSIVLDGDRGVGQLIRARLMERTIDKAQETGLALGTLRNSNDWGCGAYYPMQAAAAGFVSFCTTTSVPTIAPFGGSTRVTGNNPMAFALPRRDASPLVLDMALTPVALGKVMRARAEGQEIPEAWGFLDLEGQPTVDPVTALAGIIPAIGGYKGTGLSIMMNALAGILPGGHHSSEVNVGKRGQFFLVVSPELFGEREQFYDSVEEMAAEVKASTPLPGVDEVMLPGEIEQRRFEERSKSGVIPYPGSVVEALNTLAAEIGAPLFA
ncbi:MAG TPA: Ldh family oxidoreductase [Dehalococcoidia bacterium]|nr:Ldh family oxidoreductase [Dehalococcoidia bacterium]